MPLAIAVVMFIFWVAIAYREFQRGEPLLAVVFLLGGIVLTVFRYRLAKKSAASADSRKP
jgi:hypothetical protein